MSTASRPPKPEDFGLSPEDVTGLDTPRKLSDDANWYIGLGVGIPLALWSLWGLVRQIEMLALGLVVGVLVAVVVFQLTVFTAPLVVNVALSMPGLLIEEVSALFSDRARNRIRYRRAVAEYRNRLARGDG